jgi:hypothetical protein
MVVGCVGDSTAPNDAGGDVTTKNDAAPETGSESGVTDAPVDAPVTPFPATLSGVVTWLDAQESSTLQVTASKLTKWTDRSAFQHDAVAVSGHEPTVGTDTSKNLPIVKFNASDMTLAGAGTDPSLQFGDTGDFLVEIVMFNTNSDSIILHNMNTSTAANGLNIAIISGDMKVSFGVTYGLSPAAHDAVNTLDGKLRAFGFHRTASGTTATVRNNGTPGTPATLTVTNITTGLPVHVGAFDATRVNAQQMMTGAIGELVIVKGTVSDPDRASLEAYLMTKWKLP